MLNKNPTNLKTQFLYFKLKFQINKLKKMLYDIFVKKRNILDGRKE